MKAVSTFLQFLKYSGRSSIIAFYSNLYTKKINLVDEDCNKGPGQGFDILQKPDSHSSAMGSLLLMTSGRTH